MAVYSYPIRYFSCKEFSMGDPEEFFREKIQTNAVLGASIGTITGETGIDGLKLDFNSGLRLEVPAGNWHVIISDYDSGMVFFDEDVSETVLNSVETYYIRWQIDVFLSGRQVFSHTFDAEGQEVQFVFWSPRLGDTIAFLPYIAEFQKIRRAKISYYAMDYLRGLIETFYPRLQFRERVSDTTYATYFLTPGIGNQSNVPFDGRSIPLWHVAQFILGLPEAKTPRALSSWPKRERKIKEPYVCIGVQGSHPQKSWLWPDGWEIVTRCLKDAGYRVLAIDKEREVTADGFTMKIPDSAEDFTGDVPLTERADLLSHAEFFLGLSSGLSWVACAVGCPVVMIVGFSSVWYEFPTPYRVTNRLSCCGCMNDAQLDFVHSGCRFFKDDPRRVMECSKTISPQMVIAAIERCINDNRRNPS